MRRFLCSLVVVSLTLAGLRCGQAAPQPASAPRDKGKDRPLLRAGDQPKDIVEKVIRAYGGPGKISRWKVGHVKYRAKGDIVVLFGGKATLEEYFQYPGQFKRTVWWTLFGKEFRMIFVINGDQGWQRNLDDPAVPIKGDKPKQAVQNRARHQFADFYDVQHLGREKVKLSVRGEEKVGDRSVIVLRAEADDLPQTDYYLDTATGLLLKLKKRNPLKPKDKESYIETFLKDYKDVEGGKVPMRITGRTGDRVLLDITLLEVRFLKKVDERVFAKP